MPVPAAFTLPQLGGRSVLKPTGRPSSRRNRRPGRVSYPPPGALAAPGGDGTPAYHVYGNSGAGDPINYASPLATVVGTAWTSQALAATGTWSFGVRAFDANGEEQNLDCQVAIVLDAYSNDITNRPAAPIGLRAFATAGGSIRAEWFYPPAGGPKAPTRFHVYVGTGGTPDYSAPAATVPFNTGIFNTFVANLPSLVEGTTYSIGVRACNARGEEANTTSVSVLADATGPATVDGLTATAIV
jgi:hypothetical protein